MIRCKSCDAEIPPAFVHSIQRGECPGCGSDLFSKEEKELLDELTEAMERMPNDPQGLAGWLLSNYRLVKLGDNVEPTEEFHRKKTRQQQNAPDPQGLTVADNRVQKFLKRTGHAGKLAENSAKLAELARQIQDGEPNDSQYGEGMDTYSEDVEIEGEYEEYAPPKSLAKNVLANNVVMPPPGTEGEQPLDAVEMAKMMERVADSGQNIDTGSRALQMQRIERLAKQQGIADGSGQGTFRRGG